MLHIPVLRNEVLAALLSDQAIIDRVIDGTVGAGGHAYSLLEHGVRELLGLDVDLQALAIAAEHLEPYQDRVYLRHASYLNMREEALKLGWTDVAGILLDLGISSMQLETPERGFSFQRDGPLDMRYDPQRHDLTAADIINTWDEARLRDLFYQYGEERNSRHIARMIVKQRPFHSTGELASFIGHIMPGKKKQGRGTRIHPATRIFQALRIAVNDELRAVEEVVPIAIDLLKPGGRLAIISFHSLEDRIVKQKLKEASTAIVAFPGMASIREKQAQIRVLARKPIRPTGEEISRNPRSRSAKLRVAEKL